MRNLILVVAFTFCGVVSANAQYPSHPPYTSHRDTLHDALRDPDPIHRDERLIAGANKRIIGNETSSIITPRFSYHRPHFEAKVVVLNTSSRKIKAVSWTAILTDPATGQLIRSFEVTTKTGIAPGRKKELKKMLPTPVAAKVVNTTTLRRDPRHVADLKVAVTSVTYQDGSTSKTP